MRYILKNRDTGKIELGIDGAPLTFSTYNQALHARGLHVQDVNGKHPFEIIDTHEK